jgi:undecaprenyl-diphosphatase
MSEVIAQRVIGIDLFLLNVLTRWDMNVFIRRFFYITSRSADGYLYMAYGLILLFSGATARMILLALLSAFAANLLVYYFIKNSIKRERPFKTIKALHNLIVPPDQYSFPSGHTAGAFIIAQIAGFQFPELEGILFLWAALVGLSRVILRVHYPTDVLAGAVLGFGISFLSLTILF